MYGFLLTNVQMSFEHHGKTSFKNPSVRVPSSKIGLLPSYICASTTDLFNLIFLFYLFFLIFGCYIRQVYKYFVKVQKMKTKTRVSLCMYL